MARDAVRSHLGARCGAGVPEALGAAAGVLIGFDSEDDWFDYRLEHHPEFLSRIASARAALAQGKGSTIEAADDGLTTRWSRRAKQR